MPTFIQRSTSHPYPFTQQRGQGVVVPGGLGSMGSFIQVPGHRRGNNCGMMHAPLEEALEGVPLASDLIVNERSDARREGFNQGLLIGAGGALAATLVLKMIPSVIKIAAVAGAGWYFFGRSTS